ncbi:bifunctional methylenetetrahydrofolate dehydrogenase/methenyltetrahydrofolate cyclohydrolase FolD [Sphingomonas beigongshangi]|uniref:bifunctional methylenetetrahydrofolate dehydrogenase/methenyltetrahydrofolate cyclohydrolase FolD n=1 Tax=Sphingomonas beigongshangi TaxID=2782540 RepID=UPI00193C102F|nr:bifunctional methylenetetrahydrofolate dehydrogenase/methenyltetrahydrofolate cyclohydrolase FolD [Sphingomonas beigongshangi]
MTDTAPATLIDGKARAAALRADIATRVAPFRAATGRAPGLAVVLVGEDAASAVYVRSKGKATREAGMESFEHRLPADTTSDVLLDLVARLNADPAVDGILVQLPLPAHIDTQAVLLAIDPDKDVDGFHPVNAGRLAIGAEGFVPCTPLGCLLLLRDVHTSLAGMEAVVIGRSNIVGKPMAQLLLQQSCTVTVTHSRTRDIADHVRRADIVVAAVGIPGFVQGDWIKPGASVIDVGINRTDTGLVGDVDFAAARQVAGAITPVPGGVGPMTIACLIRNTYVSACRREGIADEGLAL